MFWGLTQKAIRDGTHLDPFELELIACLERALSFAHCGSGKVLSTSLMNPLWLSLGIARTGFPSFNTHILRLYYHNVDQSKPIRVVYTAWPRLGLSSDVNASPAFASKRSWIANYGRPNWEVSINSHKLLKFHLINLVSFSYTTSVSKLRAWSTRFRTQHCKIQRKRSAPNL